MQTERTRKWEQIDVRRNYYYLFLKHANFEFLIGRPSWAQLYDVLFKLAEVLDDQGVRFPAYDEHFHNFLDESSNDK